MPVTNHDRQRSINAKKRKKKKKKILTTHPLTGQVGVRKGGKGKEGLQVLPVHNPHENLPVDPRDDSGRSGNSKELPLIDQPAHFVHGG